MNVLIADWRESFQNKTSELFGKWDGRGTKNGKLLTLAEKEFDVFITVDRNLSFEQNLPKFNIAVVVLKEIYCCEYRSSERFAGLDCRNANYFSS